MSTILRTEQAHAINSVPGRLQNVIAWPHLPTIASQKWISELRPIKGFGTNGQMQVEIRFDDNCKNGHESFAITANVWTAESRRQRDDIAAGGCMHDDIAKVFPELAPFIRWHLFDARGPMHYVANTVYHAKENGPTHAWVYFKGPKASDPLALGDDGVTERLLGYLKAEEACKADGQPGYRVKWDERTVKVRNLEYARSSACWPEATDEQLCAPAAELTAALEARLPALLAEFRAAVTGAGFIWSREV